MTSTQELQVLAQRARKAGATVVFTMDFATFRDEGREVIESVQVEGLEGCGPHPMGPVAAAERLRELLGPVIPGVQEPDEPLYVSGGGRAVRVVAVATSVRAANAYMSAHPDTSLIQALDFPDGTTLAFIARSDDMGREFK